MANVDNPHGLSFVRHFMGASPYVEKFSKVVGYGTALFIGDPVARVADGSIEKPATPGTTAITGVNLNYGAVSTATDHLVITDPYAVFEAQDNNDTDGILEVDGGFNCNLENNAGSATTLLSGTELDESTANTTNSLDVHLLKLLDQPDNAYSAWARWEILINKHRMHGTVAGV